MPARKGTNSEVSAKKAIVRRRRKVTDEMIREHACFRTMTTNGSPLDHWLAAEYELTNA